MTEELISFETARLAKEKGFDWETEEFYTDDKKPRLSKGVEYMSDSYVRLWKWNSMPDNYPTEGKDVLCAAPTQSLLSRWLREVHRINVFCLPNRYDSDIWYYCIGLTLVSKVSKEDTGFTYEQALEEGLKKGLKLIK